MSAALYLGLGAAVIAFACGVVLASSSRRYGAVLLLGVALAGAWFVALLLTAGTDPNHATCEDCDYVWGRWWWPTLVVAVLGLNLAGWLAGATAGGKVARGQKSGCIRSALHCRSAGTGTRRRSRRRSWGRRPGSASRASGGGP